MNNKTIADSARDSLELDFKDKFLFFSTNKEFIFDATIRLANKSKIEDVSSKSINLSKPLLLSMVLLLGSTGIGLVVFKLKRRRSKNVKK